MQNKKTTQQLIREHETNMPPEILNLIKSFDWKKEVRMIVNQNQLMIDVGADLEETIYLMLLGVIQVEDLYERLVDIHEIPQDKAEKIIKEIELQIFKPLQQKLMELPVEDETPNTSATPRDAILAEIEKEPKPLIDLRASVPPVAVDKPEQSASQVSDNSGVTKPFTVTPSIQAQPIAVGPQENPVATALTTPTQVQTPIQPQTRAVDPYREPIE